MAWANWEAEWQALSEEVYSGLADWRAAHPRATFAEIEAAVEERLAGLRARLVERAALASAAADLSERPACPTCGGAGEARGKRKRELTLPGGPPRGVEGAFVGLPPGGPGVFSPG